MSRVDTGKTQIVTLLWSWFGAPWISTSLSSDKVKYIFFPTMYSLTCLQLTHNIVNNEISNAWTWYCHDLKLWGFCNAANATTRAVRDCLIRPYARSTECFVSYLRLDYECKVGHNGPIPVKCELNISCKNLLSIHTNSQVGIPKSIWTTIQKSIWSRDSLDKCVYKIWRIYLNWWGHECRRRPFLCLPRTALTGDKIIVTLVYLGEMSPSHRGWIQIVLIWTLILPIVAQ